ncbi:MAG: hypothetical protein ACT4OO_01360 [Nitrospiraceae bacterium]
MTLRVDKGACYALFAYEIGWSVNLDEAERRITASRGRSRIKHKRRAPPYFDYHPAPLRVTGETQSLAIGRYRTNPGADLLLYDFGAVTVTYSIPLEGEFSQLLVLSQDLYENEMLLADSRHRVEDLVAAIEGTIERPHVARSVEDYAMFQLEGSTPSYEAHEGEALLAALSQDIARLLRSENHRLSEQEVRDATGHRISFGTDDVMIIDWNAALMFGRDMDDALAVLEFANVELLEMRFLDEQLDQALDQAYDALTKRRWGWLALPGTVRADLQQIAGLQVDSAILFERVTNTLKLFGDQYLARVHRLASQRFHLESWDSSITRKLQTLESIYDKMTDRATTRRTEVLEWIIIILIAASIAVSFLPGMGGH